MTAAGAVVNPKPANHPNHSDILPNHSEINFPTTETTDFFTAPQKAVFFLKHICRSGRITLQSGYGLVRLPR